MISTIVPSRITEAREARAMSMEDLAEDIGVTSPFQNMRGALLAPLPKCFRPFLLALVFLRSSFIE